jgi:L-threonylcarbamoyladenylate synthase
VKSENIKILKTGGVGVIPTDTVYGIACSTFAKEALLKLFKIKGRDENKPPVVLISDISDLEKFGAKISPMQTEFINKYWPGKVTVIFEIAKEFEYLDKGIGLAIRFPADKKVIEFLKQTGPLATSSANLQNQTPAKNISEAKKYFGSTVDFYEDDGDLDLNASTLVDLRSGEVKVLRQGEIKISQG